MPLSVIQEIIIVSIKKDLGEYHPKINFGEIGMVSCLHVDFFRR